MDIHVDPSSITPLNTSDRLTYNCASCGHRGIISHNPAFNVNDNGLPLEEHVLNNHECPQCNTPLLGLRNH